MTGTLAGHEAHGGSDGATPSPGVPGRRRSLSVLGRIHGVKADM